MDGFERGRKLDKIGLKAQDTAELSFDNVTVPKENLLGEEGTGFFYLMQNLPQERLSIAMIAVAALRARPGADARLRQGAQGVRQADRQVPEHPVHAGRDGDRGPDRPGLRRPTACGCTTRAGATPTLAAMAKWWSTELQTKLVDRAVQLHGGYGYMIEYPIARAYVDSRVQTDLRRHDRDHEGDHRPLPRHLTWRDVTRPAGYCPPDVGRAVPGSGGDRRLVVASRS